MSGGPTQILIWGFEIAKGLTIQIKGGPGALVSRGSLNLRGEPKILGGSYEPQWCHVIVLKKSHWFSVSRNLNMENKEVVQSICWRKFFIHSIQVTGGSTYCEIVFQSMYTSKIGT